MKSIWMTSKSDRPLLSLRTVFTKLKRTQTGSRIWLMSGTRRALITPTVLREEETIWKLEAQSVITLLRLQPPRNHFDLKYLKPSKRKVKTNLSGMAQLEEISRRPRIALLDAWPTKCFVTMLSFVASTLPARSRSYWRRRLRSNSLQTTVSHTRALLWASSRRKSLIRMRLIPATYHTYTKTLLFEESCYTAVCLVKCLFLMLVVFVINYLSKLNNKYYSL